MAQVLNRLTYISSLSHLRRINTPIDKSGKLIPPRKLHNTQWGMICPAESPEGQSVGVVKNIAYLTHITIHSDINPIYDIVSDLVIPLEKLKEEELYDKVKLIVNGNWLGILEKPYETYLYLKDKKYKGIINIYTSIVFDIKNKEIVICNDAGRLCRPIYKVKDQKLLITKELQQDIKNNTLVFEELLVDHKYDNSILEYVDSR